MKMPKNHEKYAQSSYMLGGFRPTRAKQQLARCLRRLLARDYSKPEKVCTVFLEEIRPFLDRWKGGQSDFLAEMG